MAQTVTKADVAAHSSASDLWIIVDEDVYDLTSFQDEHPGIYPSVKCKMVLTDIFAV